MKDNKLEIVDILYDYGSWGHLSRFKVAKLTPKQAVLSNGDRCLIDVIEESGYYDKGRLSARKIGSYGHYYLESDELKDQIIKQSREIKLKNLIRAFSIQNIPEEDYQKVIDFLIQYEPKKETT